MSSLNTLMLSLVLLGCLLATSFSFPQEKMTKDQDKKADMYAMFDDVGVRENIAMIMTLLKHRN